MFLRLILCFVIIGSFATSTSAHSGGGHAHAQEAAETSTPEATSTEPMLTSHSAATGSSEVSEYTVDTKSPIVWLRLRRFFTFSAQKRSELALGITNALTEQLKAEQAAGDTQRATTTADKLAREMDYLSTAVTVLQERSDDPKVDAFLDTLLTDQTEKIAQLEAIKPASASELAKKIANVRSRALGDVVKILENDNLTDTERQEKLDKAMEKYSKKEAKIDTKLARKLTLKASLDESTSDDSLQSSLETSEEASLDNASKQLTQEELVALTGKMEHVTEAHHLLVLQKLLTRVPDTAKPGIQNALDQMIQEKITEFKSDPAALQKLLNDNNGSPKVREQVLEKIKNKSDGAVRSQVEQGLKKEVESRENAKKKVEQAKSKADEAKQKAEKIRVETDSTPTSKATATSSSTLPSPASPSATSDMQ